MGVDRCGWVRWGTGGMGDTETRQAGGIYVSNARNWVLWPGKFPRTSCFGRLVQKVARVHVHGCRSIFMGAIGPMVTGRRKKHVKRGVNG